MVRFLKRALAGEKVSEQYETFTVDGFRLDNAPPDPPPIVVGALREGMLTMAGTEADGAVVNWLSAEDVKRVAPIVRSGGPDKEVAARIFVCPSTDVEAVRAQGRRFITAYLNVPVYRRFHEWLGRENDLGAMWTAWRQETARRHWLLYRTTSSTSSSSTAHRTNAASTSNGTSTTESTPGARRDAVGCGCG
jgi:alkanesulfonate monooxygenase SsuD/methylene tetrahydromethanopterin reductase-like flavin-dependent oxidoreductase (luciferase family)